MFRVVDFYLQRFLAMGGKFTFSDDSHSVSQVGTNYRRLLQFADEVGLAAIECLEKASSSKDARFPTVDSRAVSMADVKKHEYFQSLT